ncbi:MAG: fused MFS/spermidine synthase [Alphaproteobacteria bacterium]
MSFDPRSRTAIHWLAATAGLAALSWEVIWQIKSTLALGVSAWGTALTLAVTMGGMSIGSVLMGRALKGKVIARPVRLYGVLELVTGVAGLFLNAAFRAVENLDTQVYASAPESASLVHILGIAAALGVPTICMGATLPVLGLVARQFRTSIAVLYGLNTMGAAAGAMFAAFLLIPQFGVTHASWLVAAINMAVGIFAWLLGPGAPVVDEESDRPRFHPQLKPAAEAMIVLATGFATFALEVAWFRSLTSAFHSTTEAFAVMLAAVLAGLGLAAGLAPTFKRMKAPLGSLVGWAGILVLLVTPLVERFDRVVYFDLQPVSLNWFFMTFFVIGAPVMLLGVALPWILDDQNSPRKWGVLYAFNTFAAIVGSLAAAWLLLPTIGFARTAWLAGIVVAAAGITAAPRRSRLFLCASAVMALAIAFVFESGVGRTRVQGHLAYDATKDHKPNSVTKILEFYEGPEATVAAVDYATGGRGLVIDGFVAAAQHGAEEIAYARYMAWMGHLPMLLHPDPKDALVICFGTGQTLNAVRQENPASLDIVDINPRVLKLAHNFPANQGVLEDPRVRKIVMDGRAYMRRADKMYDVITLEPMPPNFAGVNALYSREFYQLARKKLRPHGMIAQWVPFHIVGPHYAASIVKTFQEAFPNAIMWLSQPGRTGIILGSMDENPPLGTAWPGFARAGVRDMGEDEIIQAMQLDREGVRRFGASGEIITDDNQLLAYGKSVDAYYAPSSQLDENFARMEQAKTADGTQ